MVMFVQCGWRLTQNVDKRNFSSSQYFYLLFCPIQTRPRQSKMALIFYHLRASSAVSIFVQDSNARVPKITHSWFFFTNGRAEWAIMTNAWWWWYLSLDMSRQSNFYNLFKKFKIVFACRFIYLKSSEAFTQNRIQKIMCFFANLYRCWA